MSRDSHDFSVNAPQHFDPSRQNRSLLHANVPIALPRPPQPHPQPSTPLPSQPPTAPPCYPSLGFLPLTLPTSQQAIPPPLIPPPPTSPPYYSYHPFPALSPPIVPDPQFTILPQSIPPSPPTSLPYYQHDPFLAFSPLTVPNPQLAIPPAIPPPPSQFIPLAPRPADYKMVSPCFTASVPHYNVPLQPALNSTLRLPTAGLIPPSSLPRAPTHKPHKLAKPSEADVTSAGLSSCSSTAPAASAPAVLQPLTPLTHRVLTPAISPSTSSSSQPPPRSVRHRTLRPTLAAFSPSYHPSRQPRNFLLQPPTTPPSLPPPASHISTPQAHEPTFFEGAHDFTLNNPQFTNNSLGRPGLTKLLEHSMPDAFYNSAARYPPPRCHLGTRKDYIAKITDWVLGNSDCHEPILWMRGPFGVGKSAVAQSCAEALQPQNCLAATLFFSRSNTNRDDPRRVFTSIAYQIATICPTFRDIVSARVRDDPALVLTSLSTQFEELLVRPLQQTDIMRSGIEGRVVIIDGLDECRGTPEQCAIIDIIAASARNRTTPFRWLITSRPEDPIIRTMNSKDVSPVSFHLELPVSRESDHEILVYLADEFAKIRERHHLPDSWPSEEVLALLVDRTAGLWVYIATIVRFIIDENGFGPEDQLCIVLKFLEDMSAKVGADNPLTEMDFFYTLIMERVPLKIRMIVRKILLLHSVTDWRPERVAIALGLSEEQLRRSCASIQSVMELRGPSISFLMFHFYHASFPDFMKDPRRSKELCICGNFLNEYRRECLDWVHQVCTLSTDSSHIAFPSEPILLPGWNRNKHYRQKLFCFWHLCSVPDYLLDLETAVSLSQLQFRMMLRLSGDPDEKFIRLRDFKCFKDNLPTGLRDKIVRQGRCSTSGCTNTANVCIFGHGENEAVVMCESDGTPRLQNNQDPDPGFCFCGSRIRGEGELLSPHED